MFVACTPIYSYSLWQTFAMATLRYGDPSLWQTLAMADLRYGGPEPRQHVICDNLLLG